MAATSEAHKSRLVAYYGAMSEQSYLASWAKGSLGFHFGLGDENTPSLADAITATNAYLADRAQIRPGTEVLDAGCGVGGSALWLAEHRGARVTGVTLSPEQVALAEGFARERGAQGASFHCMDMCATDFPAASFDVVWQIESLCHVEDLAAHLGHVRHLLREGGRFACVDLCRGEPPDPALERVICDGFCMRWPMRTQGEIAGALTAAGFEGVEQEDLTSRTLVTARALEAMTHNAQPMLRAERAVFGVDNAVYQRHVDAGAAIAQGMLSGRTRLGYVGARVAG